MRNNHNKHIVEKFQKTPKGILTSTYQKIKDRSKIYNYPLTITLLDLHNLFLNNKKFIELYNNWKINRYNHWDKPSIDRIDACKGYNIDNMQILTWKENRIKGYKEVAAKKCKKITMYDLNGKIIKKFNSIKDAAVFSKLSESCISTACNNKKHCRKYIFKFII